MLRYRCASWHRHQSRIGQYESSKKKRARNGLAFCLRSMMTFVIRRQIGNAALTIPLISMNRVNKASKIFAQRLAYARHKILFQLVMLDEINDIGQIFRASHVLLSAEQLNVKEISQRDGPNSVNIHSVQRNDANATGRN